MSEPKSIAEKVETVSAAVERWEVLDDRIGGAESEAFAVRHADGTVLIDPLPLAEEELKALEPVQAILLTGSCHQRSAWRYRKRFGAAVHAPAGAEGLEEIPDREFRDGDRLPGDLIALHTPGPTEVHFSFLHPGGEGTLFCADILTGSGGKGIHFVPDEFQDDPARTRVTARKLLEQRFDTLCFAHGAPLRSGARDAIRRLLESETTG